MILSVATLGGWWNTGGASRYLRRGTAYHLLCPSSVTIFVQALSTRALFVALQSARTQTGGGVGGGRRRLIAPSPRMTAPFSYGSDDGSLVFYIRTPEDMEDLGMVLAAALLATDLRPTVLLLDGDLGAGKTALSRGFLKAATGDPTLLVTSPTYLLSNVYTLPPPLTEADRSSSSTQRRRVHHMDLYRLAQKKSDEPVAAVRDLLRPLNLDDTFTHDVVLVEWPERLGAAYTQRHDETAGHLLRATAPTEDTETPIPKVWPVLPPDWLDIDIRICTTASTVTIPTDDPDDVVNVQDRVVRLLPVGDKWTQALQRVVQEGYVDDFLFPDDDDD